MRHLISGLVAAIAVVTASAAPALACGYGDPCASPVYVSPAPAYGYSGCNSCGGWGHERLPDPVQQYYYVNQGPTYTGPGNFAPYPTYQESAISGYGYGRRPYSYGYDGGRYANATNHYYDGAAVEGPAIYSYRGGHRPWRAHSSRYGYAARHGYAPRFYAPRHRSMRYGAPMAPRYYGHREQTLRRYY